MISFKKGKLGIQLILLYLFSFVQSNDAYCFNSQLYTEIGCKPIYEGNSTYCPVAYNCENVINRPKDKCYYNGTTYKSSESVMIGCYRNCTCSDGLFSCAPVICPSDDKSNPPKGCYNTYEKNSCCMKKTYCPDKKDIVPKCKFLGKLYKIGQRVNVNITPDQTIPCTCTEKSNGTYDFWCIDNYRYDGCFSEPLQMREFLEWGAPKFQSLNHKCLYDWYHPSQDVAIKVNTTLAIGELASGNHVCRYGNVTIPLGHDITILPKNSEGYYNETCSCITPPLLTCMGRPDLEIKLLYIANIAIQFGLKMNIY